MSDTIVQLDNVLIYAVIMEFVIQITFVDVMKDLKETIVLKECALINVLDMEIAIDQVQESLHVNALPDSLVPIVQEKIVSKDVMVTVNVLMENVSVNLNTVEKIAASKNVSIIVMLSGDMVLVKTEIVNVKLDMKESIVDLNSVKTIALETVSVKIVLVSVNLVSEAMIAQYSVVQMIAQNH